MSHFWARWLISCGVELAIAEMACVSRISARLSQPLSVFRSNVPFLGAMSRILCSWTRKSRNSVHFLNRPQNVSRSLRRSGPVFQSRAFALVSYVVDLGNRNGVHFPTPYDIVFTICVGLVQWSISTREDSHPIVYRWLLRLNLQ